MSDPCSRFRNLIPGFCCCDKNTNLQVHVGEERVNSTYTSTSLSIVKKVRTVSQTDQGPIQKPRRSAAYWVVPHGLLCLLSHRGQELHHPQWAGTSPSITNFKNPYRLAYSPILQRHFLDRGSLLSDDYSLCQVDRKLLAYSVLRN